MATNLIERIDVSVVTFLNQPSGRFWALDYLLADAPMLATVKLVPLLVLCIWLWQSATRTFERRTAIISGFAGGFVALAIARLIQNFGPERPRPMHAGIDGFELPQVIDADRLLGWSSFPSDHAALAMALVAGIWMASRPLGLLATAWAVVVVCLPRIYAGFHYPSDLIAGGLIGAGSAWLVHRAMSHRYGALAPLAAKYSRSLYAFSFVVLFQVATLFNDVRWFASSLKAMVTNLV